MTVNYESLYTTIRAFVPVLESNGGGHIVNILSLLSFASLSTGDPEWVSGRQAQAPATRPVPTRAPGWRSADLRSSHRTAGTGPSPHGRH